MATNTIAIIRKGTTIEQIHEAIEKKYGSATIADDYIVFTDVFAKPCITRNIFVSTNSYIDDYGIDGVYLSLGCFGNSVEILKYLCETFGGHLDENDCDDIGFYPINIVKFLNVMTPQEILQSEIIQKFGSNNLNTILQFCETYLKINS